MAKRSIPRALPKILTIRRQSVVLDSDLAVLYGVPTKRLNLKTAVEDDPGDCVRRVL
jgi:hypothetical protein